MLSCKTIQVTQIGQDLQEGPFQGCSDEKGNGVNCAFHKVGKHRGGDINLQQLWLLPNIMCLRLCVHMCCGDWEE